GIERAVLVQPSVYGTDNRCLLDALREAAQEGGAAFRGIVVPDAKSSDSDLEAMHVLGVRGIRLNLVNPQMLDVDAALAMAARMKQRGWHLQLHVSVQESGEAQLAALAQRADGLGIAIVVDHMGRAAPGSSFPRPTGTATRRRRHTPIFCPWCGRWSAPIPTSCSGAATGRIPS